MLYTQHYIYGTKPYVPNFNINPEDDIISPEEYKYVGVKSANDIQIIPNFSRKPLTLEETLNKRFYDPSSDLNTNTEYDTVEQSAYGSGLVRAPKFGVKCKDYSQEYINIKLSKRLK